MKLIKFYLKLWLKKYCSSKFNCIPMGSIIPPSFAKCHMQSQPWNVIKSQGQKKTLWECHWRSKSPSDFFLIYSPLRFDFFGGWILIVMEFSWFSFGTHTESSSSSSSSPASSTPSSSVGLPSPSEAKSSSWDKEAQWVSEMTMIISISCQTTQSSSPSPSASSSSSSASSSPSFPAFRFFPFPPRPLPRPFPPRLFLFFLSVPALMPFLELFG